MKKPSPVTVSYFSLALSALALILALLGSGCGFITEGPGACDTSSSSSSTGIGTTSTTSDPDAPAESSESGSEPSPMDRLPHPDGESSSTSQPASTSESSGDESSTGGDIPCDDQEDCELGQQCDPTLGYICVWPYDINHCDETCPADDRITHDWAGTPTCYCATPCVLEADCDADQICNPLLDRCVLSCANGPNTCPQWSTPTMVCGLVDEMPPYVQMCLYTNEQ